jgi:ferredoxin
VARVEADVTLCDGYANCVVAAPALFGLDNDGLVVVKVAEIDNESRPRAEEAVRNCPVSVLSIRD